MSLRRFSLSAFLAAAGALAGCQSDRTCVHATDCPAKFTCIPDSSGVGHCLDDQDVFGSTTVDAGPDAG